MEINGEREYARTCTSLYVCVHVWRRSVRIPGETLLRGVQRRGMAQWRRRRGWRGYRLTVLCTVYSFVYSNAPAAMGQPSSSSSSSSSMSKIRLMKKRYISKTEGKKKKEREKQHREKEQTCERTVRNEEECRRGEG